MSDSIPKIIFCRNCMEDTVHIEFPHIHERRTNEFGIEIYQIVYCKVCKEAILEIFYQYLDESKTRSVPERHPDIPKGFKKPIQNVNGVIDLKVFTPYCDCIKCYNQQLYRASFMYLIITVNSISDFLLLKLGNYKIIGKSLAYKANLLKRKNRKRNIIVDMFLIVLSKVLTDYKKCLDLNFMPDISNLDNGIDLLHKFLYRAIVLESMEDSVEEEFYLNVPKTD